jgi:hypothetical protein
VRRRARAVRPPSKPAIIYRLNGGKVVERWIFVDSVTLMQPIGVG